MSTYISNLYASLSSYLFPKTSNPEETNTTIPTKSNSPNSPKSSDPTFSSFDKAQALQYAQARAVNPPELYSKVLSFHAETGGQLNTYLDVGCGPGTVTQGFAKSFNHAIGIDHGKEMVGTARQLGGVTKTGEPIRYEVSGAEGCASVPGVENGVDVLTASAAAHWFPMQQFWAAAASIIKPGGTVALWTYSSLYCHPDTPNAEAVQKALFGLERHALTPYDLPATNIARDLYVDLPMPWNVEPAVPEFSQEGFVRVEWDRDGVLTDGKDFLGGSIELSMTALEMLWSSTSMVTRWREANPDLANTDQDCVKIMIKGVKEALEGSGQEKIKVGCPKVLLLFKRQ